MNTLSIVASFGALVWIFQDGNLSLLFGTRPLGFVETTQPVILFCVLFGLSMDYEVFLLTRMRESWERDRRQPDGGRARPRAERADRHLGGAHRHRRRRLVRLRRHRPDQGARRRDRDRGRARRDGRPGPARAGHDAAARALELVAAGSPRSPAADARGPELAPRPGRARRSRHEAACALAVVVVVARRRAAAARRSSRTRRSRSRRRRRRPPPTVAPPPTRSPIALPRDDGPHDRLTEWWYYTGHLRADDGRPLRVRGGRLPRRARRRARSAGRRTWRSPTRPAIAFLYAQRSEIGPQVDRSPRAATARRPASTWRQRPRPGDRAGAPARERLAARRLRTATTGSRRPSSPEEAAAAGAPFGLTLDLERAEAAGPARRRRLGRLRTGGRLVLLLADADGRHRRARRSTASASAVDRRSPGSTTSGATSSRSAAAAGTGSRSTSTTART